MAKGKLVNRRKAIAIGGAGIISASITSPAVAASPERSVLTGVTIVNTHDGTLTRNMSIVIEGGKIAKIAAAGSVSADAARKIDARGKFVVPGYNDYHAHPLSSSDVEGAMALMLAHGVTGFREMAGNETVLQARKAGKFANPNAPELLQMPGETLNPGNAGSPEAAVATVQKQHAQGADFIKVIDVRPEAFYAALAEANRLGLRFMGHLPPSVDVRTATSAGMHSIEHIGPRDAILLGCSSDEAAIRQFMAQNPPKPPPPAAGPPSIDAIRRGLANPTVTTSAAEFERYKRVVDTFSETRMQDLANHFVTTGTWQVPTLIRIRTMEIGDDPQYRNDPNLRYIPPAQRAMWEDVSKQFETTLPQSGRDALRALFALQMRIVKPFKAAGVQMMAGSDLGGGFVIAGFGLHQEFDLLEQAGLTPLDVLQMTTLNGAKFLGREATMGSVSAGKNANLVLLDANPVESVGHLHGIAGVVRAGTYYSKPALDAMLQRTAQRLADSGASIAAVSPACCKN